ncbi:hypothetical protein AKJ09_08803 [Labilithrix luteola]|uniref:Uncharacterized protein n=1 Tax=Labilithrix luteola TaxID=1391654 RepID=A0A0K1Q9Q0_9BACT|nr:hypothetical protein AKJ09_08803 [Labilithrix luteola]
MRGQEGNAGWKGRSRDALERCARRSRARLAEVDPAGQGPRDRHPPEKSGTPR